MLTGRAGCNAQSELHVFQKLKPKLISYIPNVNYVHWPMAFKSQINFFGILGRGALVY